MSDLDGVIIAFDLDNTLLDPTGARYDAVTSEFLARYDLGLGAESVGDAYERVRRWGPMLARLGFANVLHDRGHVDGLAALALLFATRSDLLANLGDSPTRREAFIALLDDLDGIARGTRRGSPQDRLGAERLLRLKLSSQDASALRSAVNEASKQLVLREWSATHNAIEDDHPVDDVYPMLRDLIGRGAICVVISQGQSTFQRQKLQRLGIARLLSGQTLITQDARRIAGYDALDVRIDALLACDDSSDELNNLWVYRCLLDVWGSKSRWFYARCLHALHGGRGNVEKRVATLTTVSHNDWTTSPPRLVMIGDRYEKDIRPVIDLLGFGVAMTAHLCAGKYNEDFSVADLPKHARPTRSFDSMSALREFLDNELTVLSVSPVETPPPIAPDGWFDSDALDFGAGSDLECVRNIAGAIRATRK